MRARNALRQARPTLLVVGEGDAEEVFLKHLRQLLTGQGRGCQMTVRNAQGKGAGHVVTYAQRQKRQADYDRVAVLLDTDTDWTPATRKLAKVHDIAVLACEPCLEAWLLTLLGKPTRPGESSAQAKVRFQVTLGGAAHSPGVLANAFPLEVVNSAAKRDAVLGQLLGLVTQWPDAS
jgi:hypothetical protein